ncbi:MAG TPA: hypothetical protein VGA28_06140, partial [Desulfurivibrionaceae bacterium]
LPALFFWKYRKNKERAKGTLVSCVTYPLNRGKVNLTANPPSPPIVKGGNKGITFTGTQEHDCSKGQTFTSPPAKPGGSLKEISAQFREDQDVKKQNGYGSGPQALPDRPGAAPSPNTKK